MQHEKDQIGQIEQLRQEYLELKANTPYMKRDGAECKAFHAWYEAAYVFFSSIREFQDLKDFKTFADAEKVGNCFALEHIYDSICPSYKVLISRIKRMDMTETSDFSRVKTPKIFISHCGADKVAVSALVDLLGEIININSNVLFCSSVHDFDVMVGKNFMDNILAQYKSNDLFLLYVFSHNYMRSPICLNEMGASWMTKNDSVGILLPGLNIEDLGNSCYDKQAISIIFNQGESEVKHRLNQLKETIEKLFPNNVRQNNTSRWEEKRDHFITTVMSIPVANQGQEILSECRDEKINHLASIVSSVYYKGKGDYVITFTNQGKGTAENLTIEFEDVDGILLYLEREMFPIEIFKPGQSFQIKAMLTEGAPHKMLTKIKWEEANMEFEDKELILFNK